MRRPLFPILAIAVLISAGCRGRDDVPYLGRWDGTFRVDRLTAKTQINNAKRNNWNGYILLYRTADGDLGNRCQMNLENEQEGIELKGHWKIVRKQIEVAFNDIKIDDAGGIDLRDPNKSYIEAPELRAAFKSPLALNIQTDLHTLKSQLVLIGPLAGEYSFSKASLAH